MSSPLFPSSIEATFGPVTLDSATIADTKIGSVPLVGRRTKRPTPADTFGVLHLVNGEHFSGAERVQSHLGRCLPDRGVTADFACVKPGKFADMLDQHAGAWGKGFRTEMKGRLDLRVAGAIGDLVRRHGYDLLHAHTPRTAMIAALVAKRMRLRWIYHVHSPASRDSDRVVVNRINAWIEKLSLRTADHLITVSESLRQDCLAVGTPADKVTVVHNGVPGICPPRESTPVVGGRWTIGMIALMRPRKGLEVALGALSILKTRRLDVHLRCIGPFETDAYQRQILRQVESLGLQDLVQWQGFTDDVPQALSRLDAMVLPSLFGEGLPMVVLEAMAAAVPVIATAVEGTPEAVTDGVEGLLALPRDAESLADKITDLVTGKVDWQSLSTAAESRHATQFSDHAMAQGVGDVYRRLFESGR